MTECTRIAEQLAAYADAALSPGDQHRVEQHLAGCPGCQRAAAAQRGGRRLLRARAEALRTTPLPPGLRSRCEALVSAPTAAPAVMGWRTRMVHAGIMATLVLIVGAAVFYVAATRSEAVLAAEITADHDRCFRNWVPADAPSLDAAAVEADLARRFGWDMHVPPSSEAADVHLVHARRCLLGRARHILYRAGGENLSLYMLEGEDRGEHDITAFGTRSRMWTRGATTYVLVSSARAGDLSPAVDYLKQELQ